MPQDPLQSSLIFIPLQICSHFATHRKKLRVRKFGALLPRKFLDMSLEIIQLMRKISNRESKNREMAQMLVDIKGSYLEIFLGGRGNSLHTALVVERGQNN